MPIHKEGSGEQWGNHGKVYHGPDAKEKAEKQAAAAHANGWRGDAADRPICAGILFVNRGKVFLIHRTDRDEWEGPGGHIEDGETPAEAAIRETEEETGIRVSEGALSQPIQQDDLYTAFVADIGDQFDPQLNHEHNDSGWFPLDDLPDATHPNIQEWANGMTHRNDSAADVRTEMDIARDMRDGKLKGPQFGGTFWFFDIRITGTGFSTRAKDGQLVYREESEKWVWQRPWEEHVYRDPKFYLNDDFLERCQGLPVIFEHPEKSLLNTEEFRDRNIGSIALPYIPKEDDDKHLTSEVWGIARIYDLDAAETMLTTHISTSPGVSFQPLEGSKGPKLRKILGDDGVPILIEDEAPLIDHIAICPIGVWDKGGEPRGVA